MKKYTYDWEIATMVTQFIAAIDEIIVKRYNNKKQADQEIKVRFVYAPKQRVMLDLIDKAQNIQLPVVACYITGIQRDVGRVFNKIGNTYRSTLSNEALQKESAPLPIDLNMGVTIMTKFQTDMDQILGNLLPYFNPYIVISWRTPERLDSEIRAQVLWNGSVSITYPYDINSAQNARVVADLQFTIKGWLFQALDNDGAKEILVIHSLLSSQNHGIPCEYSFEQFVIDNTITDVHTISGSPPQPSWIEPYYNTVGLSRQFVIGGKGFTKVTNVYLSGVPFEDQSEIQDPFATNSSLSAFYPSFVAKKLDPSLWKANNDNAVTFIMPPPIKAGLVDVIIEGPRGYGALTKYTRVNTFNPFLSATEQFANYIPYQAPYLQGIIIHPID